MSLIVLDIERTKKNLNEEIEFLLTVLQKDFDCVRQKLFKLINRQHATQVIYMALHYEKRFAVFYDIKVMNVEVFA